MHHHTCASLKYTKALAKSRMRFVISLIRKTRSVHSQTLSGWPRNPTDLTSREGILEKYSGIRNRSPSYKLGISGSSYFELFKWKSYIWAIIHVISENWHLEMDVHFPAKTIWSYEAILKLGGQMNQYGSSCLWANPSVTQKNNVNLPEVTILLRQRSNWCQLNLLHYGAF